MRGVLVWLQVKAIQATELGADALLRPTKRRTPTVAAFVLAALVGAVLLRLLDPSGAEIGDGEVSWP